MIFDANRTSLGSSIPMAEGYDGTVGVAQALIESARNDYAMFRAMLDADARELSLRKSGYVAESEILALQEATSGSIWKKIAELFNKLIAKIKGIFANFLAKFRGLYMKDKQLVKTYADQIMRKSNIGKMEIKWRKTKDTNIKNLIATKLEPSSEVNSLMGSVTVDKWNEDTDERWKKVTQANSKIGKECSDAAEVKEALEDKIWEDDSPNKYEFEDIFSGARELVVAFDGFGKLISDYEKSVKKTTSELDKKVKEYNKLANDAAKAFKDADDATKDQKEQESTKANRTYDMAVVVNDVMLTVYDFYIEAAKEMYKQTKAVFMKAVTVNNDKLAESSIYAQAVAEAAEQEVEDVISGALDADGKEMLASTSIASQDLNPGDGYELGYDPSNYSDNIVTPDKAGYKDATTVGTEESSIFSSLLY